MQIGKYFLALQDDGNLAVYKGTGPSDNKGIIWNLSLPKIQKDGVAGSKEYKPILIY